MGFLRRALGGLFLISLTLGLLAWGGQVVFVAVQEALAPPEPSGPARERVFAAHVVPVVAGAVTPEMTAFGTVRAVRMLELRAPAAGSILALADGLADGAEVKAGQMLIRLDPADAQAARAVAANDLAIAQGNARDAARAVPLAQAELAGADAQASLRQRALDRQRALVAKGAGTDTAVQEAELVANSAAQAVLAARSGIAAAEARRDQAMAEVEAARLALAEAERALAATELRAAFAGTLADVSVVAGGRVAAGERLGTLVDPAALEVSFRLSTRQYAQLLDPQGGLIPAEVAVALDVGGAEITARGRLARVGAEVGDGQTGRLIFASLDSARGFRPGDFVTVRIAEPVMTDVALLPAAAVGSDGAVLLLGPQDRLEPAPVEVLRRQGDEVIVKAAALAGREVVAERTPLLGAGIKVNPLRPGTGAGAAASDLAANLGSAATVALEPARRAALIAFVEGNDRMPPEAKARVLAELRQDRVPAETVARIEQRMGG